MRRLSALVVLALAAPARALAADSADACIDAYESAQVLRKGGRLVEARDALVACAQASCPAITTVDCTSWLREVEASLPSIVLAARMSDGRDVVDVRVLLDGAPLATALDGRAMAVDPGRHRLRFERAGSPPLEREIVAREGEKARPVMAVFPSPAPEPRERAQAVSASSAPARRWAALSPWGVAFGAAGAIALGAGVFLDVRGYGDAEDLRACTPSCPQSRTDAARRELLAGDVAIGVGLASLAVAAYFLLRPAADSPPASQSRALTIAF